MTRDELIIMAKSIAPAFGLDPALVCGVIQRESDWNPDATRFEPEFKIRYIDRMGLQEPEATCRSTSWGLMQLMGENARESGYSGPIPGLLDPNVGVSWGCRWLEKKLEHAQGNVETALLLWNGGGNPAYPAEVLAYAEDYK